MLSYFIFLAYFYLILLRIMLGGRLPDVVGSGAETLLAAQTQQARVHQVAKVLPAGRRLQDYCVGGFRKK